MPAYDKMPTDLRLYYSANRTLLALLDLQELLDGPFPALEAAILVLTRLIAESRPPTPPDSPCPCGCDSEGQKVDGGAGRA